MVEDFEVSIINHGNFYENVSVNIKKTAMVFPTFD